MGQALHSILAFRPCSVTRTISARAWQTFEGTAHLQGLKNEGDRRSHARRDTADGISSGWKTSES